MPPQQTESERRKKLAKPKHIDRPSSNSAITALCVGGDVPLYTMATLWSGLAAMVTSREAGEDLFVVRSRFRYAYVLELERSPCLRADDGCLISRWKLCRGLPRRSKEECCAFYARQQQPQWRL